MASDDQLDERISDSNDRLVNTLEKCFSELMQKQESQSDKFYKALKALKPKPPAIDKNTAFWTAYKTLADEHDKEFQQKYSTDLDTSLIFAGLFSAVDSAFIIQIQPDIQPHGTPLVILVAQNLLYVSLFSTLLAALLAVLGKQWLMYYMAAGERGTIEARGLERQRKFDGLRRWKFDAVMQIFPLLLQLGLFLFSAALSIYLWRIHLSLALVVLSFTSIGFISYTTLLISAVASPDSPFQSPLVPLLARLIPRTHWTKAKILLGRVMILPDTLFRRAYARTRSIRRVHNLLPFFKNISPLEMMKHPSLPPLFEGPFPTSSQTVPAVSWVLETSTDPCTIVAAAGIVADLQWPGDMDVKPHLSKLRDGILSCCDVSSLTADFFAIWSARDGMSMDAIRLGQAYCTLRCVLMSGDCTPENWQEYWCFICCCDTDDEELKDVLQRLAGSPNLCSVLTQDTKATSLALNVISSHSRTKLSNLNDFLRDFVLVEPVKLDQSVLADYLFTLALVLSSPSYRGLVWMDKRKLCALVRSWRNYWSI
ncbi:hypothetical protein DFH06DRAFT_140826 [Mycena polygramma]|nr:hypothetical protein DFH06DRAFT_140826 [Mycena polygramma]